MSYKWINKYLILMYIMEYALSEVNTIQETQTCIGGFLYVAAFPFFLWSTNSVPKIKCIRLKQISLTYNSLLIWCCFNTIKIIEIELANKKHTFWKYDNCMSYFWQKKVTSIVLCQQLLLASSQNMPRYISNGNPNLVKSIGNIYRAPCG